MTEDEKTKKWKALRIRGLRQRWIVNTIMPVLVLLVLIVTLFSAGVSSYYYSSVRDGLEKQAQAMAGAFNDYFMTSYTEYYQMAVQTIDSFEDKSRIELQFIDARGRLVVSSYGSWAGASPTTEDIAASVSTRGISTFVGQDPATGERIMAVSSPMIYSNGEVIGVLRYVTSTRTMDLQILQVAMLAALALAVVVVVLLISNSYLIRSILVPIDQITEKAKMIAAGSYGAQIQTQYDDEIGELAETINEMSSKISQNEKMQTEFISSLSHELRTPLTAINGWSETLLFDQRLDEQTRRGMKIIHTESQRLTEMVMELLDFTRLQDGRFTLNMESTDIWSEFEDTVYMYGSRLSQEGIRLVFTDSDEGIPQILCDPKRMRQVFWNILDNAAKHGGDGKQIDVSMKLEEGFVVARIRDYGHGIPADELPLVKRKFYKGSSKARGSGIGLAVCDEIVALHGGTLELENAPGGGTLVTVRLPVAQ